MKQKSDGELVALTRSGQKRAFGQLITRYLALTRQIAADMVGNGDIAQELAQEALLQAYLSLEHLREPERFKSWLCGIVLNVCRGYRRDQQAGRDLLAALPRSVGPDAWVLAERRERQDSLREAVRALSPENRAAVELFYYEQCSLQEVAAALGISVAAVKGRLHKARRQLRARLLPLYPDLADALPKKQRRKRMVKVTVAGVFMFENEEKHVSHFVLLTDETGRRLRIWVGQAEAWAISHGLTKAPTDRPMTIDFMANLLRETDARLEEVRIEAIRDETFYAIANLNVRGERREMDARPSDAIALAVRTDSPVFVAEEIMAGAETDRPEERAAVISFVAADDAAGMATAIIRQAIREGASQITGGVGPGQANIHIFFRIDNDFVDKLNLPKPSFQLLVTQFKIMADMDIAVVTAGQQGQIHCRHEGKDYVLGVTVTPTEYGEMPSITIRDKSQEESGD